VVLVVISCRFEWAATLPLFPGAELHASPFGQWFCAGVGGVETVFLQGGWGKISAAASAQYGIGRWQPRLLVNLGTCGGFPGAVEPGEVLLIERTVVYDIEERMTGAEAAIAHYTTEIDLSWLPAELPQAVRRTSMASADRDLAVEEVSCLAARYGAVAGDWESGAIAWVAARNGVRCLILRGVSDIAGEAYGGNAEVYVAGAGAVMRDLIQRLPGWLRAAGTA
jgi:adenosylhomocysteine nucleosidase